MLEYHKIETLFERDEKTKKLIEGKFRNPSIEFLKDNLWEFTEKIDGTNIRILWDGHKVTFAGRTDKAQIPAELANRLFELFGGEANEQMFEQKFGETEVMLCGEVNEQMFEQKFGETEVMLCGEGYGAKIQNGGLYKDTQDFILFDVLINGNWQPRDSVKNIAEYFGIDAVPLTLVGTIKEAVEYVKTNPKSAIGTADSEGLVGRPCMELKDRCGNRMIVKIKVKDFE